MCLGCRRRNLHKNGRAVEPARQSRDAPRQRVLGAQAAHLLDLRRGEVVPGLVGASRVPHLGGQGGGRGRGGCGRGSCGGDAGGTAHACDGSTSGVAWREEEERRVFGRGLGRGRVVDDAGPGWEWRGAVGEEGVVGCDFEGALGAGGGFVAAHRRQGRETLLLAVAGDAAEEGARGASC